MSSDGTTEIEVLSGPHAGKYADASEEALRELDSRAVEYRIVTEAERAAPMPGPEVSAASPVQYPALDQGEPAPATPAPVQAPTAPPSVTDRIQQFVSDVAAGPSSMFGGKKFGGLGAVAAGADYPRAAGRGSRAPQMPPEQQTALAYTAGEQAENERIEAAASRPAFDAGGEFGLLDVATRATPGVQAFRQVYDAMGGEIPEELPVSRLAVGQAATLAATAPFGAGEAAAATLPGRAVQMAKYGGVPGALFAGAEADAETPEELGQAMARGGVAGTAVGLGLSEGPRAAGAGWRAIQRVAGRKGVPQKLEGAATRYADAADEAQLQEMGYERGTLKTLRGRKRPDQRKIRAQAEAQREMGIKGPPRKAAEQAEEAIAAAQAEKDELAAQVADVPVPSMAKRIREALLDPDAIRPDGTVVPGMQGHVDEVNAIASEFEGAGTFAEANAARNRWGQNTKFASETPQARNRKAVYNAINEAMEEAANAADEGVGSAWRAANRREHHALNAKETANNALNKSGNRRQGLRDAIASGSAAGPMLAITHDPIQAAVAGVGGVALRRGLEKGSELWAGPGHRMMSRGARGIAGMLQKPVRDVTPGGAAMARVLSPGAARAVAPEAGPAMAAAAAQDLRPEDVLSAIERDPDLYGDLTGEIRAAAESGDVETMRRAIEAAGARP